MEGWKRFLHKAPIAIFLTVALIGSSAAVHAVVASFSVTYSTPPVGQQGALVADSSPYGMVNGNDGYGYLVNLDAQSISTLDLSNPAQPLPVAVTPPQGSTFGLPFQGFPTEIFKRGNFLFTILNNTSEVAVVDVSNPLSPKVVAKTPPPGQTNGLPTGSGPINGALVGTNLYVVNRNANSVSTVDISNPLSPIVVSTLSLASFFPSGGANGIAAGNGVLFVASRADSLVATLSITSPQQPVRIGLTPLPGMPGGFENGAGPSALALNGSFLYAANFDANSLSVLDVSAPQNPSVISTTPQAGTAGGLPAGGNPHAIAIDGRRVLVANANGLVTLVDIGVPNSPISYAFTPVRGASGGLPLNSLPQRIYLFGGHAYTSNYASNTLSVFRLSDLPAAPSTPTPTPSNQLAVTGSHLNYALPAALVASGVAVVLISKRFFKPPQQRTRF